MSQKRSFKSRATVVALEGELGSGKTTFVQHFARACGITESVLSPTFVILKSYTLKAKSSKLIHIDAYRLKNAKELEDLGIYELMADEQNIIFIEWASRVQDILPNNTIRIHFDHVDEHRRKIRILNNKL